MPQRLPCKFQDAGLEKRLRTHDGGADRRTLDSGSRWSRQAGPPAGPGLRAGQTVSRCFAGCPGLTDGVRRRYFLRVVDVGREASPPSSTSHVTGAARGRAPRRLERARRGGAPGAQGRDFVPPRVRSESPFFARARICYVASEQT